MKPLLPAVLTTTISCAEDERDASRVMMRLPMFEALVRGYLSSARGFLTKEEIAQLAFSGKLITYELATRFLADHLNGDTYFKTNRPGHNLDLSGLGRFDGSYYVTRVEHQIDQNGYLTTFEARRMLHRRPA